MDLDLVVRSHGWYDLPPFEWAPGEKTLGFVFILASDPIKVTVRSASSGLIATATPLIFLEGEWGRKRPTSRGSRATALHEPSSPIEESVSSDISSRAAVRRALHRVLNLEADLSSFHSLCRVRRAEGFAWIARRGAGRILRAPTLFEDAVKVLATTNCTWELTKVMVKNLIAAFDKGGAFPDAAFVAGLSEARLRNDIRVGYRAPYFAAFAERVASGELDLSRWEDPARPDEDVEKEIRSLMGFGPYAADTLGRLLNRHGKLGLDSWSRKKVAELRFRGRRVKDSRVEKLYRPFGRHAGLAFWLDVTREWHGRKEKLWP